MGEENLLLSVIIPTKNEEHYLPRLLRSIKEQDFNKKYEVIVADADSTDSTRKIAKKFECRIIKGGRQAVGVNNGAIAAKGDILLIIDADAVMPPRFLAENFKDFTGKKLDVASCYIRATGGNKLDKAMHVVANAYYFSFKKIRPFVPSFCLFVKKEFFHKTGRFDENIPWLVDLAFSNSLPKNAKYDILPINISLSVRMAERLGRFGQAKTLFLASVLRTVKKNYYGEYKYK